MPEPRAQRTLVKSPPELWAEISDAGTLARHLGEFGEIRITRLEAETTVAWEGDRARGTVELEPSGWGTKVTITAVALEDAAAGTEEADREAAEVPPAAAEPAPWAPATDASPAGTAVAQAPGEPAATPAAGDDEAQATAEVVALDASIGTPAARARFFARLFRRRRRPADIVPEILAVGPEVAPEPEPELPVSEDAVAVEPEPEPEPEAPVGARPDFDADHVEAVLVGVLDDLGAAHHRPFSRG